MDSQKHLETLKKQLKGLELALEYASNAESKSALESLMADLKSEISSQPKKFSPERLENFRRMRKARRLYKKTPVFALQEMQKSYPGYIAQMLKEDLKRRTKPKKKDKKVKSNTKDQILREFYNDIKNGDDTKIRPFLAMLKNRNKPFEFRVQKTTYYIDNQASYGLVKELIGKMKDPEEFKKAYNKHIQTQNYGK